MKSPSIEADPGAGQAAINGGAPSRKRPLPLEFPGVHKMDDQEVEAAARVLRARSPFRYYGIDLQYEVDAFEREFAEFIGVRHALAVSSGTGALHCALAALGVGPGQEVIVPAYAWVSCIASVVNLGAIPVIADIDDSFCLDPVDVERKITPHTRAILFVHMSGAPGDALALRSLAERRSLFLLEDCAQCAGGTIQGRKVGTFGHVAIFSFQMNKNMTAGEGGCLVTDNTGLYRRAFASHDLGYARDASGRLDFSEDGISLWGRGYRMDELRGAVLRVQLRKLPSIIRGMRRSKWKLREVISQFPGVGLRRILDPEGDTGGFLITTYKTRELATGVNRALRAEGIVTFAQGISNILLSEFGLHLYYKNLSLVRRASVDAGGFPWNLPANQGLGGSYEIGACPVADSLFERSILVPVPSCLTKKDDAEIAQAFRKVLGVLVPDRSHNPARTEAKRSKS